MAVWDTGLAQLRQIWGGLGSLQKTVFVAVTAGLVLGFVALGLWAGAPEYAVLYGGLAAEDAAQVVERLKSEAVPYELRDGGRTIRVPSDRVHDIRLTLAGEGLPQGGVVGFEIFDQSGFGMTDFAQKVNYARALEGELTRTIRRLEGVQGARVHLVLPERRLFEQDSQPASASVVLQLGAGRRLSGKQIQGVVYLVASSVEGLGPDRITVVDTQGNVLYQSQGEDVGLLAANQLEFKRAYEKEAERRVRDMLERVLGNGTAVVQVAATFDFDRVEETSETYDPEAVAVRSEERVSESATGGQGQSGVPGVASNVEGAEGTATAPQAAPATPSASNRESETVNYEVSKKVTRIQRSQGVLRRLTVAVAVDGTYRNGADGEREFVPRTAEELDQLRLLVQNAVGADAGRGDAVQVTSIPFSAVEEAAVAGTRWGPELLVPLARYGVALLVLVAFVLFVARPLVRWLTRSAGVAEVSEPVTVAEMEARLGGEGPAAEVTLDEHVPTETVKREMLKKRVAEIVQSEPQVAAQLIRSWISKE